MDMKRILQAMDGVATKPVAGASDMVRFLRVVKEADINQPAAPAPAAPAPAAPQASLPSAPKFYITKTEFAMPGETPDFTVTNVEKGTIEADFDSEEEARSYVAQQDPAGYKETQMYSSKTTMTAPEPREMPAQQPMSENSIGKFLSIVDKNDVSLLMEGNPHKVSLPVQMAMQHYQKEEKISTPQARVGRESVVRKYFDEAEQEVKAKQIKKQNFYKQYGQTIAERVLMKESINEVSWPAIAGAVGVGGEIAHRAAGGGDAGAGDSWDERIFPGLPYSRLDLAFDLAGLAAGGLASAIAGPGGEAVWLASQAPKVKRVASFIQKALSFVGANVIHDGAKLLPPLKRWVQAFGRDVLTTAAFHSLTDLIGDALDKMEKESQLHERSTTEKQARTMAAAAHNPAFAKKVGIDQKVAKEFNQKDKGTALLSNAMKGKRKKVKENEVPGHSMGFNPTGGPGMGNYVVDETPLDFDKENPAASTIHSHQGVNPASIEARIMRARGQLKDLSERAQTNDLLTWENITRQFPELAMNMEQIRHGIDELARIRKQGGRRTANIPKHIGETNPIKEANAKKKSLKNSNPCWKGYHPVGTKKKGGRTVPNCVPKE